jgi:hypothetical protein
LNIANAQGFITARLDEHVHLGKSSNSSSSDESSLSSSASVSSKFHPAAMTESESSFREAISRAAAVSVSQGLLCLNGFTNHRQKLRNAAQPVDMVVKKYQCQIGGRLRGGSSCKG